MNPETSREAILLAYKIECGAAKMKNIRVIVAPPFPFLIPVARMLKKAKLCAQDSSWAEKGAFTGEVSWKQLKRLGVTHVIIGHSERRMYLNETDETVNKKIRALLTHGLIPILCIGEYQRTGKEIPAVVGEELKNALKGIKKNLVRKLIVAYEPIWAISTMPGARPDTPDNAFRAVVYIRKIITDLYGRACAERVRIIYGGSVKAHNVRSFLREGKMEGALIGGASLDAGEFIKIVGEAV